MLADKNQVSRRIDDHAQKAIQSAQLDSPLIGLARMEGGFELIERYS